MNGFPFSCTHRHAEHTRQHAPAPKVKCPVKTILNLIRRTCVVLVPTHNACWVPSLHCSVLNGPIHPEVSNQSQVYDLFFFFNAPRSKVTITRVPVWSIWWFQSFPFLLSPLLCCPTNLPLPTHPSLLLHLPIANAFQWLRQWENLWYTEIAGIGNTWSLGYLRTKIKGPRLGTIK